MKIQLENMKFYKNSYMLRYEGNITYNDWMTCSKDVKDNNIKISIIVSKNEINEDVFLSNDVRDIICDGNTVIGLTTEINSTYFGVAVFDNSTSEVVCSIAKNINTSEVKSTCYKSNNNGNKLKTEHIILIVIGSVILSIVLIGCIGYCCLRWKKLNNKSKENNGMYGTLI